MFSLGESHLHKWFMRLEGLKGNRDILCSAPKLRIQAKNLRNSIKHLHNQMHVLTETMEMNY